MEDLYYQQLELSELIRKIPINIKKDSADRKSDDYFKRRLEMLEKYWSDYQNNHLAICEYGVKDHTYFINCEHEKISKHYTAAKSLISEQRLQMSSKLTPLITVRSTQARQEEQKEAEEEAGPSGYEQPRKISILRTMESRGSTSKLDDMIRKQAANFKAFKRSAGFIDLDSMSEKWEMEDALSTLQARWSQIDSLHWEIDSEMGGEDDDYEAVYTQHERSYIHLKKLINKKLWSVSHREHSTPKMDIPVFSGNYQQWTSFKDLFTEAIHSNPTLSQAQKMQFLKGKVQGEAERLIQHLPISSSNYDTCWEILNHRYNNKKLIFTSIINTMLGLSSMQHQAVGHIKKLHDVALESLHAIRNLGIDISTWDPLLVHLLSQKLDTETYGDYIDSLKNSRDLPVLQDFLDYLENKFTSLETSRRKVDQASPKSINHLSIDEKFCKLDNKLKQCVVIKSPCQDRWLELNDPSRYMYFCCNTYSVRIICQDQVSFKQMTGVGIIDLGSKCVIKSKDFTLYSHLSANTIKSNSEIPTPQIAELNHMFNISLSHYTAYEDPLNSTLVDLGERIEQLKSANTNLPDYSLSTHDIHQYIICYGLLGVAVLLASYFLWRRCRAVSSVELSQSVANSVVFSRKQRTADRQPSVVNITSEDTKPKRDISTSPMPKTCRFRLEDV